MIGAEKYMITIVAHEGILENSRVKIIDQNDEFSDK
jgi:hypothetical protein